MKIANSVDPFGAVDIPEGDTLGLGQLTADGAPYTRVTDRMVEYQPPQWDPGESDKPSTPPGGNTSGKDPYSDEKYNSGLDSHRPVFNANQLKANMGKFHSAGGVAGQAGRLGVELPTQGLRLPQTRLPDPSDLGETPGGFADSLPGGSGIGPDPGRTDPAGFTPDPAGPDGGGYPDTPKRPDSRKGVGPPQLNLAETLKQGGPKPPTLPDTGQPHPTDPRWGIPTPDPEPVPSPPDPPKPDDVLNIFGWAAAAQAPLPLPPPPPPDSPSASGGELNFQDLGVRAQSPLPLPNPDPPDPDPESPTGLK